MRRRRLDVHRERGRIPAQSLRPDTQLVHRARELRLEPGAFRVRASAAQRPRRGDLGEMDAQIGGAADADADDRRRAGLAACVQHTVNDKCLDRVHTFGRNGHLEPGVVLRAAAFRNHLDGQRVGIRDEIDIDHGHQAAARRVLVNAREGMHDRRADGMLARRPLAPSHNRLLELVTRHLHSSANRHVIDRDARVLAEQVAGVFGDRDVANHRAKHGLRRSVGLAAVEPLEPLLDVGRQQLQRPDIEFLARILDLFQIDLHLHPIQQTADGNGRAPVRACRKQHAPRTRPISANNVARKIPIKHTP